MGYEVGLGGFQVFDALEASAFNKAWNLEAINFPNKQAVHNYGAGVKIGIIDSGYSMQDGLPIPVDIRAFGYPDAEDKNGHGTHVFGILSSIARNADYYIVRALGADGNGVFSNVVKGIEYLISKGVDIIQISIGGTRYEEDLHRACRKAANLGIAVVCSNGNSGRNQKFYPSGFEECISVGATDKFGGVASFSTTGEQIDLVAPGDKVVSNWIDGSLRPSSGSSMAAPHVSGVAALVIDHYRGAHGGHKLDLDALKAVLYRNAQDMGLIGWDKDSGAGIVQVQFHKKKKDLKVDAPKWINVILKVASFGLKLWLKKRLE